MSPSAANTQHTYTIECPSMALSNLAPAILAKFLVFVSLFPPSTIRLAHLVIEMMASDLLWALLDQPFDGWAPRTQADTGDRHFRHQRKVRRDRCCNVVTLSPVKQLVEKVMRAMLVLRPQRPLFGSFLRGRVAWIW